VGDPKQSIYRFRRADISVYDAVRNGPLAGAAPQLVQNFRSTSGVIAWVNDVFDRVLVRWIRWAEVWHGDAGVNRHPRA
jgi:ATP-dependent helicase/nuclease subunit A